MSRNINLYYFRNGIELDVAGSANFIRDALAQNLRRAPFFTDLLLGGVDRNGASLYYLDYLTCMHPIDKAAHGHAAYFLLGLLDSLWRPVSHTQSMSLDEGKDLVSRCIEEVKTRFLVAQPVWIAKLIDAVSPMQNGVQLIEV